MFRQDIALHVVRTVKGVGKSVLVGGFMETFNHSWDQKKWTAQYFILCVHVCVYVWTHSPIWALCPAWALSTMTLGVRSDTSHGRNSCAVVTLIRYSITVSLLKDMKTKSLFFKAKKCADNILLIILSWFVKKRKEKKKDDGNLSFVERKKKC